MGLSLTDNNKPTPTPLSLSHDFKEIQNVLQSGGNLFENKDTSSDAAIARALQEGFDLELFATPGQITVPVGLQGLSDPFPTPRILVRNQQVSAATHSRATLLRSVRKAFAQLTGRHHFFHK